MFWKRLIAMVLCAAVIVMTIFCVVVLTVLWLLALGGLDIFE